MKKILKQNKGITLIALVITIIVLLLLAGTSIQMLSAQNGILTNAELAKNSVDNYNEKEQIETEVFGSFDRKGKLVLETLDSNIKNHIMGVTTNDPVKFPLIVTYTKSGNCYSISEDGDIKKAINYPTAVEVLGVDINASTEVEKSPFVNYTDSNENTILCRVLYNDENGIDLISSNALKNNGSYILVTLGLCDPKVTYKDFTYVGSGTMNMSDRAAAASYNRALETLNEEAEKYRNKADGIADSARCVGSLRGTTIDNPDTSLMYNYTGSFWTYMETYNWNGIFKDSDINSYNDYFRMEDLGINNIGTGYWLASRNIYEDSTSTQFLMRFVSESGGMINHGIFLVGSNGSAGVTSGSSTKYGFRPVFHLSSNVKVISGEGTESSPYILDK